MALSVLRYDVTAAYKPARGRSSSDGRFAARCGRARQPAMRALFEINPALDLAAAARRFADTGRVQVRDVLTRETAEEIRSILARQTPWGVAVQAGREDPAGPRQFRAGELATPAGQQAAQAGAEAAHGAIGRGDYAFLHARYSLVEAYLGKWAEGSPHDLLVEYINAPEFLDLARAITGIDTLIKADAHASLFAPGHFLTNHSDEQAEEGWRVAYVLNFAMDDWHTDWGGYLVFYDADGDIVEGFKPRFNALNLFRVPLAHSVTYVPPFAPAGRLAISGWLRDR